MLQRTHDSTFTLRSFSDEVGYHEIRERKGIKYTKKLISCEHCRAETL
jgi:hypothetical protein